MDDKLRTYECQETDGERSPNWIIIRVLMCLIIAAVFCVGIITGIGIHAAWAEKRSCYVLSAATMFPMRDPECGA